MLERHVTLRLQTNAGSEDIGQCIPLLVQAVDDGGAWRGHWRFEHVTEDG